jgi:hypothetical protein
MTYHQITFAERYTLGLLRQGGLLGEHAQLGGRRRSATSLRQIGGRQLQQVGEFPHEVGFVPADLPVREYDAPHHLGQDHLLAKVVVPRDGTGELVVIDSVLPLGLSEFHQFPSRGLVQAEMTAQC